MTPKNKQIRSTCAYFLHPHTTAEIKKAQILIFALALTYI